MQAGPGWGDSWWRLAHLAGRARGMHDNDGPEHVAPCGGTSKVYYKGLEGTNELHGPPEPRQHPVP